MHATTTLANIIVVINDFNFQLKSFACGSSVLDDLYSTYLLNLGDVFATSASDRILFVGAIPYTKQCKATSTLTHF